MKKYLSILVFTSLYYIGFLFSGCKGERKQGNISLEADSAFIKIKYSDAVFTIPSPNQTLILLKNINSEYQNSLVFEATKTDKYTTTFKKSIVLGIWGADISYLHLYNQKELALPYINNIKRMLEELDLTKPLPTDFFKKMESDFGNSDSMIYNISELFRRCDEYLKYNDRNDIGALIITGGWLEGFYLLTKLYEKNPNPKLLTLVLYQKEVINNLIKIISPYYTKSTEYKELGDDLVNIAYEFDVVDISDNIEKIFTDTVEQKTFVKNQTNFVLSGSQLNNISNFAKKLRDKYH